MRNIDPTIRALIPALEMLMRRDEMNAAVHCAEVRYSPVTLRLARFVFSHGSTRDEYAAMCAPDDPYDPLASHWLSETKRVGEIWLTLWSEWRSIDLVPTGDEDLPMGYVFKSG